MATRVLIVSDEPARLPSDNDALVRACPDWQLTWVPSAPAALEYLRDHPVEIVVCELRQPQTAGSRFINEVGRQFPTVLRAITGEVTEKEMISQFVRGTHHFLSKHLEAAVWRNDLARALTLDRWLGSEQMRSLVANVRTFPSVPSRYFEVLKELRSEHPSPIRVGEIIASDMAMYTKIIQVLSSSFYGIPRKISDPTEAVSILGFEMVKSLVLCIQVFSQFDAHKLPIAVIDGVWNHSTRVAHGARKIAIFEKADRHVAEDAFTAGLLHDIGKLILFSSFPDKYRELTKISRESGEPTPMVERQLFGVTHGEISAYLLVIWGMPLAVGEAVAYHHHPSRSDDSAFSPLSAVHVADTVAREIEPENGMLHMPIDDPYFTRIGLDGRTELWRQVLLGHDVAQPEPAAKVEAGGTADLPHDRQHGVRVDSKPTTLTDMVRRIAFWRKR